MLQKDFILNFKNNKCKIFNSTKNISLNCEKKYIVEVKNKLNHHIKQFNKLQKNNSSLRFQKFEFSGSIDNDKQLLNSNHVKFESWAEGSVVNVFKGLNKIPEAEHDLHRINNNIHMLEQRLEHWYNDNNNDNPYVYSRISYTTKNKRIKMNSKWYDSFSMQNKIW